MSELTTIRPADAYDPKQGEWFWGWLESTGWRLFQLTDEGTAVSVETGCMFPMMHVHSPAPAGPVEIATRVPLPPHIPEPPVKVQGTPVEACAAPANETEEELGF